MSSFGNLTENIEKIFTNFKPQFSNRYKITVYADEDVENKIEDFADYISLYAKSISFGGESLNSERHNVTKKFFINQNAFKWQDTLTIEWYENSTYDVRSYHTEWLRKFYDRSTDQYVSGKVSKYRTIQVEVPTDESNKVTEFIFKNCIPVDIPSLDLAWSKNPNITTYKISYKVESYSVVYNKNNETST